jgi:hypothetical protein
MTCQAKRYGEGASSFETHPGVATNAAGGQDEGSFESPQDERKKGKRGPKTEAGKAIVRLNPVKHGVLAQTPVLPLVEREEDWLRLRDHVRWYYAAREPFQESLADRIAGLIWRLKRVERYETEIVITYLNEVPRDWEASRRASGRAVPQEVTADAVREMDEMLMARLLPGEEQLAKAGRYEVRLHKHLLRMMHQMLILKGLDSRVLAVSAPTPDLDPPGLPDSARRPWRPESTYPRYPARRPSRVRGSAKGGVVSDE